MIEGASESIEEGKKTGEEEEETEEKVEEVLIEEEKGEGDNEDSPANKPVKQVSTIQRNLTFRLAITLRSIMSIYGMTQ